MRPERLWSVVIFTLGLFMALGPLSAQAGPNRPMARQPHRQAFTSPQSRGHANYRQPQHYQQPRGQASGWNGQNSRWNQPRVHSTLNRQPHRYQQPRGHAYGWNGQNRQWNQPRGHAYGWNRQPHRYQQPRGHAYGWNGNQRPGHQPHAYGWNGQQRPGHQPHNGGQYNNPGSPFNRAGHQPHSQPPNIAPNSSGHRNSGLPAAQNGERPGYRHPEGSWNGPPQDQSPSGVI